MSVIQYQLDDDVCLDVEYEFFKPCFPDYQAAAFITDVSHKGKPYKLLATEIFDIEKYIIKQYKQNLRETELNHAF